MTKKQYNKYSTTFLLRVATFIICGIILFSACQDSQEVPPIVVTEVFTIAGEELVVTRILEPTPTPTIVPTPASDDNSPVILDVSFVRDSVPNIDPQATNDPDGIDLIENLFVGLTRYNHVTNRVDPALAQEWEVSNDGRTWTFHLRDDIFWVQPSEQTVDGFVIAEAVRPVVAGDMVFAIQRACARETDMPDAFVLFLIEGCEQVHQQASATPADLANIGTQALNDTTLRINLNRPAAHFLTITSLWFLRPLPHELFIGEEGEEIEGDDWQTAMQNGTPLLTSGPFMPLDATFSALQRNTLWPIPFQGNTEIIKINYVDTETIALGLWEAKSLDVIDVTDINLADLPGSTVQQAQLVNQQTLLYLNFNFQSGVFREPAVRRAFSAAIDREALVEEVYGGDAVPMRHLIPPGVFGALPVDQVGLGYSPDFARIQMAESGFGSCRLMPEIRFMVSSSDLSLLQAELIIQMWVKELGCAEDQFQIEQVQFGTLLANTRPDAGAARPDVWELAWASYYPDAHNWLGDLIHCQESENRERRPCGEVDSMIQQAATTVDTAERQELYRQIENMLFGDEGIMPLVPLYARGDVILVQNWLTYPPALFGGEQYDSYEINMDRKELERSRSG